jgi:hypothetical protein
VNKSANRGKVKDIETIQEVGKNIKDKYQYYFPREDITRQ